MGLFFLKRNRRGIYHNWWDIKEDTARPPLSLASLPDRFDVGTLRLFPTFTCKHTWACCQWPHFNRPISLHVLQLWCWIESLVVSIPVSHLPAFVIEIVTCISEKEKQAPSLDSLLDQAITGHHQPRWNLSQLTRGSFFDDMLNKRPPVSAVLREKKKRNTK